jgi:hypothetical protein
MMVSCARLDHAAVGAQVQVVPGSASGPLVGGVHLAAGVHVAVDLMAPGRWHAVSGGRDVAATPLLRALVGDLTVRGAAARPTIGRPAHDVPASAAPWLRVAVVDALDRWLQTPLDECLLDAERGVVRGRAARTLPHGPARAVLTGDALRLARRSSHDLVAFLRRLGRNSRPVPNGLSAVLKNVVDGYAELAGDVTGPDRDLLAVLDGWRRLSRRLGGTDRPSAPEPSASPSSPSSSPLSRPLHKLTQAVGMIDPWQVRARVLVLSADPAAPEVTVSATDVPDTVLVRVPAFGPAVDPDVGSRLLVRLVDRRSGEPKAHALLRASGTDAACLTAIVPLWGMDLADVRADVADALIERAPAADDADDAVQEARRAVVFLAEWRRLVGIAQLGGSAAPARRLRELALRLQPTRTSADAPLFTGGPSCAELEQIGELTDDELLRRLRGDGPIGEGLRAMTAGPGGLLVAELAALVLSSTA